MTQELYCEVCDRDASDTVIIARWHDMHICTDCLQHHDQMVADDFCED
jgi:hypothetical protein